MLTKQEIIDLEAVKTLAEEARTLAYITEAVANELKRLAEDWAELQKWAAKAAKDAEKAAFAAHVPWAREGDSELFSALVYTAAEAIASVSQDWPDQAKTWVGQATEQARRVAQQAKRVRKE